MTHLERGVPGGVCCVGVQKEQPSKDFQSHGIRYQDKNKNKNNQNFTVDETLERWLALRGIFLLFSQCMLGLTAALQ